MLSKIFPKTFNFFDFLDKQAGTVVSATELFKEIVKKGAVDETDREKMRVIEHEGDGQAYAIIDHLNKTFVTPFDREDIHELAKKLDDINDMIDSIVRRMKVYRVAKANQWMIEFADLIYQSAGAIACAVRGLRSGKASDPVIGACTDIRKLESAGDKLRDRAMGELFEREKNAVEILKWKELYQDAENALDICKVVAHTIEGITVKNS
jgi:uncharacterized protein